MPQQCPEGFLFNGKDQRRGGRNVLVTALHTFTCYPINGKSTLGSLYDAVMDRVLTTPFINDNLVKRDNINEESDCKLIKIDRYNQNNLLKAIGIRGDLRLSIALKLISITDGILMLHNYEVPPDTTVRLLSYSRVCQRESLINNVEIVAEYLKALSTDRSATHLITNIERGFDFVIALQYPLNADKYALDCVLDELCGYFNKPNGVFLPNASQQKINTLKSTIFTSSNEIRSLPKNISVSELCQRIYHIVHQTRNYHLLSYTMHPVRCVYDENLFETKAYQQIDRSIVEKLEDKWIPLSNGWKRIKSLFSEIQTKSSQNIKHFDEQIQDDLKKVEQIFKETLKILVDTIIAYRRGHTDVDPYNGVLNDCVYQPLNSYLNILLIKAKGFLTILNIISQLKISRPMEYINVARLENDGGSQETIENKLLSTGKDSSTCCLCFTHELVNKDLLESQKAELSRQLNASTQLVLADFSTCKYRPQSIKILSRSIPPLTTGQNFVQSKEINILLVGETGVGKSTFINAFVNYLAYQTLQQALCSKPVVLIPVSFIITTGDQFIEHTIEFGQIDPNEHHQQAGESVTQHCRSYLFTINNNTKLRIIDTPGLGDTRGVEQDNKNIEQILSYINNLSHLNAICFLLKPDVSRLHTLFRSCFIQLFHYLGSNANENIIFCFTNTRATFYTPGNTTTLLKEMLKQLPNNHVPPFGKSNTFCFDSESFRYVAVIKAGHQLNFDEQQKLDFERSWTISKNESNRLLTYLKTRSEYKMDQWRSIKHAQMRITMLARPILETMRNAMRNLLLYKLGNRQFMLELIAEPIPQMAWICPNDPITIISVQEILIARNDYAFCHCSVETHLPTFYKVHFQSVASNVGAELENKINQLLNGCVILSHFLLNTAQVSDNPFLRWIDLFIKEQEHLHMKQYSSSLNEYLFQYLHNIRNQYQNHLVQMLTTGKQYDLNDIYRCINDMLQHSEVSKQMDATEKTQANIMKSTEYDTSVHFNLN